MTTIIATTEAEAEEARAPSASMTTSLNALLTRRVLRQLLFLYALLSAGSYLAYIMLWSRTSVIAHMLHPAAAISLGLASLHVLVWLQGTISILERMMSPNHMSSSCSTNKEDSRLLLHSIAPLAHALPFLETSHPWTYKVLVAIQEGQGEGNSCCSRVLRLRAQSWKHTLQAMQAGLVFLVYACTVDANGTLLALLSSAACLGLILYATTIIAHVNAPLCAVDWLNCALTAVTTTAARFVGGLWCSVNALATVLEPYSEIPVVKKNNNKTKGSSNSTTTTSPSGWASTASASFWTGAAVWTLYYVFQRQGIVALILYVACIVCIGILQGLLPAAARLSDWQCQAALSQPLCKVLQDGTTCTKTLLPAGLKILSWPVWMILVLVLMTTATRRAGEFDVQWLRVSIVVGLFVAHYGTLVVSTICSVTWPVSTLQGATRVVLAANLLTPNMADDAEAPICARLHQLAWNYQEDEVYIGVKDLVASEEQEDEGTDIEDASPPRRRSSRQIESYPTPLDEEEFDDETESSSVFEIHAF